MQAALAVLLAAGVWGLFLPAAAGEAPKRKGPAEVWYRGKRTRPEEYAGNSSYVVRETTRPDQATTIERDDPGQPSGESAGSVASTVEPSATSTAPPQATATKPRMRLEIPATDWVPTQPSSDLLFPPSTDAEGPTSRRRSADRLNETAPPRSPRPSKQPVREEPHHPDATHRSSPRAASAAEQRAPSPRVTGGPLAAGQPGNSPTLTTSRGTIPGTARAAASPSAAGPSGRITAADSAASEPIPSSEPGSGTQQTSVGYAAEQPPRVAERALPAAPTPDGRPPRGTTSDGGENDTRPAPPTGPDRESAANLRGPWYQLSDSPLAFVLLVLVVGLVIALGYLLFLLRTIAGRIPKELRVELVNAGELSWSVRPDAAVSAQANQTATPGRSPASESAEQSGPRMAAVADASALGGLPFAVSHPDSEKEDKETLQQRLVQSVLRTNQLLQDELAAAPAA